VRILLETPGIKMGGLPIVAARSLLRRLLERGGCGNFTFNRQRRNSQNRVLLRHHRVCSKRFKSGFLSHESR
jgi:hypothetical protein